MDVLRQAVRLIGLDLHLVATNPNAPFSGTIISLPCLTTLVILETHAPNFEAVAILELINAPLLQAMSYNAKQDCPPRSTAFISCLRRSPNIRELCISQPHSLSTIIEYISHCPALLNLHVSEAHYTMFGPRTEAEYEAFLRAFIQDDGAQLICPQLEIFSI